MKQRKRRWCFIFLSALSWLLLGSPQIFLSLCGIQEAQAAAPAGSWWDNNYSCRQQITINNINKNVRVQTSTATIAATSTSQTATLSPAVDTTKAFLVFGLQENENQPVNGQVTGQITNSTTVTFQRSGTTGAAITVKWYVAEFTSGVSVQRGTKQILVSDTVVNVPISSVNTTRSFPIISFRTGGSTYSVNDFVKAKITTSTNLELALAGTGDASNANYVEWQVIEYADAFVQSGDLSFGTTDSSLPANPSTPITIGKSWLIYTYNSADGTATDIGQKLVRGLITNTTTLTFDRSNTGQTINLTWYLVEFNDSTAVQHSSANIISGGSFRSVAISPIDTTRTIATGGYFMRGGRSNFNTDDNAGAGWFTLDLTSPTTLVATRGFTGLGADVGWFVIEFPSNSVTVPSGYSVLLPFDHASMINKGQSLANGNDVRVVYWNGSSWVPLDRVLNPLSSWNSSSTKIWLKTQAQILANGSDDNYYLYYSYPSAGAPLSSWANVFDIGDDFNDGTLTGTLTTSSSGTASITETGGELFIDLGTNEATDSGMLVTTNSLTSDKKFSIRHKTKLVSGGGISNPEVKAIGIYQLNVRPGVAPSATENPRRRINAFHRVDGQAWIIYNPSGSAYYWSGTAWVAGYGNWGTLSLDTYYVYDLISDGTNWYVRVSDANGNPITTTTPVPWSNIEDNPPGDPLWFYWGEPYTDYYYADQKSDWVYLRKYVYPEPTASLGPVEARFDYRRQITISDSMTPVPPTCTSNLTNFPVLISLSGQSWLRTKPNGDVYNSNGYDIIFRASDGETQLDHEIEQYDGTNGTLVAWVRIPTLVYNGPTYIYMYYGNSAITSPTANPTGVWNTVYGWQGVWHLSEATTANRLDSTNNGNTLTPSASQPTQVVGMIASAANFASASSQKLSRTDALQTGLDITGTMTVEAWVNLASVNVTMGVVDKWRGSGTVDPPYILRAGAGDATHDRPAFGVSPNSTTAATFVQGPTTSMLASTWYHIVGVYDGTNLRVYKNGAEETGSPVAYSLGSWNSDGDFEVGTRQAQYFTGIIDEVRVSATARDACWIATEYNNQNNPGAFITVEGTGQRPPPTAVKLTSFTATQYSEGILLKWKTGYEVNNLGFHVYREENGQLVRLTPEPVAGSALVAGSRTALTAGHRYRWWDAGVSSQSSSIKYWLKDIDLNGTHTMHGPVTPLISHDPIPDKQRPELLSERGWRLNQRYHQYWKVRELKERLALKKSTPAYAKPASAGRPFEVKASNLKVRRAGPLTLRPKADLLVQQFLAGRPAVKFFVKEEGWYRVSRSELVAAGLNSKINPQFLQLYVEGEEQPIQVIGKKNWDAIEFYGVGVDTLSTDTRVYWLIEGTQAGKRIDDHILNPPFRNPHSLPDRQAGAIRNTFASFPYTVQVKDRWIYLPAIKNGEEENFFGAVVYGSGVDQLLNVQHLDPAASEDALLEVVLQGATSGPHRVKVLLNKEEAGEVVFEGQAKGSLQVEVSQGLLHEGDNLVSFVPVGGEMDVSLVDSIRLTYWHTYTADDNSLRLTAQGGDHLTLGGFSSSRIRLFDITDPGDLVEVLGKVESQKGGYAVSFRVPGHGQRTLMALTEERIKIPEGITSNKPSWWYQSRDSYDLVIISHRDFLGCLQPLKSLRESQGLGVALIDIEDLYDEFSFGVKSPGAIKDFLTYAKTKWQKPPRFVLLVGDASFDPRNYLGSGEFDFVPTKLADTAYMETASDDWFVDLNNDGLPEMAVGRLPVQTAEEAAIVVSKIVGYERSSKKKEALLVSDVNDGFNFEGASEEVKALLPAYLTVRKIVRGEFSNDAQAKGELLNGINQGVLLVNFIGHGSIESWRGGLLTLEDAESLINGLRLPFFVNMTCLNGYFQDPYSETLGEALLKAPQGGAIGVWTSSGLTEPDKQAVMNKELIKLLFDGKSLTLGEATARAKASVSDQDIRKTWILFGDPTTRLK